MVKLLGISAFYHDSAASFVVDGEVVASAQEERFTREKHTAAFPTQAINYCLDEGGVAIDELDAVVFYDKPLLKFERLLQTYYAFAPRGIVSFLKAIPVWLNEKMFLKKLIRDGLADIETYDKKELQLFFPEHHLSHAASAFYPSPYHEAAILTVDGVGEWSTSSIGWGKGKDLELLKELQFPHSVGLFYSAFTYFLGFKVNSGEYKLMGLAPYGDPNSQETQRFIEHIKNHLLDIKEDGSVWLNQSYFKYATGLQMIREGSWERLFGFPVKDPDSDPEQKHCNLALAVQRVTEEIVLKMAAEAKRLTNAVYLCLAGGVALNCVANGRLLKEGEFKDLFIQPAAGDAGGALGAALAAHHLYFDGARDTDEGSDAMKGSYLGPYFSEKEIDRTEKRVKAVGHHFEDASSLARTVAERIAQGEVVGWFQGRMEFGPRALGNRSILGDPRDPSMQKKLNLKIKYREGFRPFAPAVLAEEAHHYFDLKTSSPYMLLVGYVQEERRNGLPDDYFEMPLWDRLYYERSDIPAVTHLDFSARVQTVHKSTNPRFWELIDAFKQKTGYALLVNTSFNVRGEPVVCTPYDAYRCFMSTEMDHLVIGDRLYHKGEQPEPENKEKWMGRFEKD